METPTVHKDGTIRTQRLILRAAQEKDLGALHELFSNEEVMRYWSCAPHTDIQQTANYLHSMLASPINGTLDFVIVLVSPPTSSPPSRPHVIGKAGIWSSSTHEIGFMLHRSCWGQGYMAEALSALLGREGGGVVWKRGVERVVADVDPRNAASVGVLRLFGFVETGRGFKTFETHLGWCDSVYLELRGPGGGG